MHCQAEFPLERIGRLGTLHIKTFPQFHLAKTTLSLTKKVRERWFRLICVNICTHTRTHVLSKVFVCEYTLFYNYIITLFDFIVDFRQNTPLFHHYCRPFLFAVALQSMLCSLFFLANGFSSACAYYL